MQDDESQVKPQIEEIRREIQEGIDDLDKGRYITTTGQEVFEDVIRRGRERVEARANRLDVSSISFQVSEEKIELDRFITAILEGEKAILEGRTRPAEEVFAELKAKYGF